MSPECRIAKLQNEAFLILIECAKCLDENPAKSKLWHELCLEMYEPQKDVSREAWLACDQLFR